MIRTAKPAGFALIGAIPLIGLAITGSTRTPISGSQSSAFAKTIQPAAKKYCAACHSGKEALAGFDVQRTSSAVDLRKYESQWREAAKRIADRSMPPSGSPSPTDAERKAVANAIVSILGPVKQAPAPSGTSTIRRLNRTEYNNTVRDLFFGAPFSPADDFPSDDVGYGFDNIGDVLSISPLLMERYLDAAETIARKAIVVPRSTVRGFDASNLRLEGGANANEAIVMYATAKAVGHAVLDQPGSYRIKIRAYGQQAGPEAAKMALILDGRRVAVFDVKAVNDPALYEAPVELASGRHTIEVAFINDYYAPNDPNPKNRDRNLIVHSFELVGPTAGSSPVPQSHRRIVFVQPDPANPLAAGKRILGEFARRAYRRPPTAAEIDGLARFVDLAIKDGEPFERGIQLGVTAILSSPKFLFRGSSKDKSLSAYETASRLSYFLWSTMPDEPLFRAAADGSLSTQAGLLAQVDRLLADPRSVALSQNFAAQWLQLRKLESASLDPEMFPDFDERLKRSMALETQAYFDHMVRADRPVVELIDSNYAFVNERLARHYGMTDVAGEAIRRVELTGGRRGGLLSQGSFLTVTSNPNRTSPVKRGKFVLEQILGEPPPPPPPGAGVIEGDTDRMPTKTMKERLARHRRDPACSNCHMKMDSIGFAFENYDPTGKWRDSDGPFKIDASGQMPGGAAFRSANDMRKILVAERGKLARSIAEKLLIYALGRGLTPRDESIVQRVLRGAESKGGGMGDFVRAVAMECANP